MARDTTAMFLDRTKTKKPDNISYKLLRWFLGYKRVFEICELYSNSWRILDVPDCRFYGDSCVSLKGKTYWIAFYKKETQLDIVSFDYTTREI